MKRRGGTDEEKGRGCMSTVYWLGKGIRTGWGYSLWEGFLGEAFFTGGQLLARGGYLTGGLLMEGEELHTVS